MNKNNEKTEFYRKSGQVIEMDDSNLMFLKNIKRIQKVIDKISSYKKVSIYGAGEHTEYLLKYIDFSAVEISCIYDKKDISDFVGYVCKKPSKENMESEEIIIVSSFWYSEEITEELKKLKIKAKIINLYDESDELPFYRVKLTSNFRLNDEGDLKKKLIRLDSLIGGIQKSTDHFIQYRIFPKKVANIQKINCFNQFSDIGIVIQGPVKYEDDFTYETIKYYKSIYPNSKIVLSTWKKEAAKSEFSRFFDLNIEIILNDEPQLLSQWKSVTTINYQLLSTYNGLKKLKEIGIKYALKVRSDMRINSIYFMDIISNLNKVFSSKNKDKQQDRLIILPSIEMFNIPDYLMFGCVEDMMLYWKFPIDIELLSRNIKLGYKNPEKILFRRYIDQIGEKCVSYDEYIRILRDYFIIMDMDDFNVFWGKYSYNSLIKNYKNNHKIVSAYDWLLLQ